MKSFDLLDPQDFERAVEESGLDVGVLRAIRFGMVYGSKGRYGKTKSTFPERPQEIIRTVDECRGNVINLAAYRFFRGFKEI